MFTDFENVYTAIIAALPSISAIIGIITAFIKIKNNNKKTVGELMDKFEEVRTEVMNTKQYEDLKNELKLAHQENRELKKKHNELLTKIDKIARTEED